ncbi:unnamed protein product [Arabidopsis halleri]
MDREFQAFVELNNGQSFKPLKAFARRKDVQPHQCCSSQMEM